MATTMPIDEFAEQVLLNRCLREGPFQGPRLYGKETKLWKSLSMLSPEQKEDGTWKGDAQFFFATPVHEPLAMFQDTLRDISRQYMMSPNPGEHLTKEYVPRIIQKIAETKKKELGRDTIELTPEHIVLITPFDAAALRGLMVRVFEANVGTGEEQDEKLARAGQLIFEGFITDAYEMLNTENQEALENLIEKSEDPNEVMAFLERRIHNFDQLLAAQVFRVKQDYDELTKMLDELEANDDAPADSN
jgi:hypothetical protein